MNGNTAIMQVFSIGAVGWKPVIFLRGVVVALPVLIAWTALWASHSRQFFFAGFVLLVTVPVALLLAAQLGAARLRVDRNNLIVGGGLYQETVPLHAIQLSAIRSVPPEDAPRLLGMRTNGVGMPGLSLGWYWAGKAKKVFAAVGGGDVLYVPVSGSFDLVVSPVDSAAFLAAMSSRP